MVAFLKEVYGRAKEADKFLMSRQSALKHSWNTMMVSSFWDMRLSRACAATDAEYQNRIILHDNTLNLPVVAQQPATWEVVRIQVVSSRLLQVQKIRENDRK